MTPLEDFAALTVFLAMAVAWWYHVATVYKTGGRPFHREYPSAGCCVSVVICSMAAAKGAAIRPLVVVSVVPCEGTHGSSKRCSDRFNSEIHRRWLTLSVAPQTRAPVDC
jgi:hypothetical protein